MSAKTTAEARIRIRDTAKISVKTQLLWMKAALASLSLIERKAFCQELLQNSNLITKANKLILSIV